MPQAAKPARLWFKKPRGVWYILYFENGQRKQQPTRAGLADRAGAEKALADFLAGKPTSHGTSDGDRSIAQALNLYLTEGIAKPNGKRKGAVARPYEVARRAETLLSFFGDRDVDELDENLCQEYWEHRGEHRHAARRELEDLSAALGYAFKRRRLDKDYRNHIELPPKAPPRQRWLTVEEAARLVKTAWRFKQRDRDGAPGRHTRRHLARFILVGLYTGTRSAAICGAAMGPAIGRGHVDLDNGIFYRRAPGTHDGPKKQPEVRLPDPLLAHIRRWKRRGFSLGSVVEYENQPVASVKKAFKQCVIDAGLETEGPRKVTPHTLRHTAITWMLQAGKTTWEASDFFGVSEHLIRSVYGHHCPDRHAAAAAAMARHGRRA